MCACVWCVDSLIIEFTSVVSSTTLTDYNILDIIVLMRISIYLYLYIALRRTHNAIISINKSKILHYPYCRRVSVLLLLHLLSFYSCYYSLSSLSRSYRLCSTRCIHTNGILRLPASPTAQFITWGTITATKYCWRHFPCTPFDPLNSFSDIRLGNDLWPVILKISYS